MKYLFSFLFIALATTVTAQPAANNSEKNAAAEIDFSLLQQLNTDHSVEELQLLVTPLTLEQLQSEADRWLKMIQAEMIRIANLKIAVLAAEGEDATRLHDAINEATSDRNELIGKAQMIVDSMELKGADTETIDYYRKFISGALASELAATDSATIFSQVFDWMLSREGGLSVLLKAATIIVSVFLLVFFARLVQSISSRIIHRVSGMSHLMQEFMTRAVFWITFLVGLLVALAMNGVSITPLFALVGGASFILAFAMQETLGNLAAGMMIMINKPFDEGDLVDTNGVLGVVETVSIVSTTIRTLDNQVVILPNSAVWGSIIKNVTVSPVRRVDMVFGIGYGDDIDKAAGVLEKLVSEHPLILDEPEPNIRVHELADSSVNFICRPWTKTEDYWTVYWDLTRQVKEGFDAAGVCIPFPQRDVHLYQPE